MKKNVILFKCHYINKEIIEEYNKLTFSCDEEKYDVVMLYDNSNNDFSAIEGVKVFLFSLVDFEKSGYPLTSLLPEESYPKFGLGRNLQWFHADYPILFFYRKYPKYQNYWQVEFDLLFNGLWDYFFSFHDKSDADFISTNITSKKECPDWDAWGANNFKMEDDLFLNGTFPIVRYSNRALILVDKELMDGMCGYCEMLTPTLLNIHKYQIENIDKNFYNNSTLKFDYSTPYFLYNTLKLLPWNKNKLFHPIRKENIYILTKHIFKLKWFLLLGKTGRWIKNKIPASYKLLKPYFPDRK